MRKNFLRLASLLLAAVMLISAVPLSVSAEEATEEVAETTAA